MRFLFGFVLEHFIETPAYFCNFFLRKNSIELDFMDTSIPRDLSLDDENAIFIRELINGIHTSYDGCVSFYSPFICYFICCRRENRNLSDTSIQASSTEKIG